MAIVKLENLTSQLGAINTDEDPLASPLSLENRVSIYGSVNLNEDPFANPQKLELRNGASPFGLTDGSPVKYINEFFGN